ncbi:MAG: flagellar biosynthesis protein FliQ [Candidatus Wallbacteria bacterium]|nr:flagellar biosynthesis protein FliQ [Candidatus Wallbacteria bacterium]
MDQTVVISLARDALKISIAAAGPILILGVLVGLVVSILQTATSIQEQTLTFVPKILAILFAMVYFGPKILSDLVEFTVKLLGNLRYFVG